MTLTIILLAFMLGVGVVNLIVILTLSNKVDKYMAALAALAPVAEDFSSEVQTITDAVSRINGAATAVSAELPPTS